LIDELRDLLDAEQQLTRALPRLAEAAAAPPLRQAFQKHLKDTERHLDRLNQALSALGEAPRAKRCIGMRGLITEGNQMAGTSPKGALRDAIMISGAQKVEHYEMAAYGTARTYAEVLGRSDVARLLDESLEEEKAADQKLTEIAEQSVNVRAAEEIHKRSGGIFTQSAEWVGSTVGTAARTVRRAAGSVGLGNMDAGEAFDFAQAKAVNTVRHAAAATADTVSETARAAIKRGRRLTNQARSAAADVLPTGRSKQSRGARRTSRSRTTTTAGRRKAGRKK
jgi:ferritin-like metal-binding protein YciE